MKKRIITCPYQIKEQVKEYFALFSYTLEEETEALFSRYKMTFVKEEDNKKYDEIETKYTLSPFLSFIPVIIGCLLILLLVTLFLVFTLSGGDRLSYFLYFMLPAFIILPLNAIYTYLRFHFDSKNIQILSDLNIIKKELEN